MLFLLWLIFLQQKEEGIIIKEKRGGKKMYCSVLVEIQNQNVDRSFTYQVPSNLPFPLQKGVRVEVPFQNRVLEGFVLDIFEEKPEYEVKEIIRVIDQEAILTEELLLLGKKMKEMTLAPLISCYQTMLPKALKAKVGTLVSKKYKTYIRLLDASYLPSGTRQREIMEKLKSTPYIEKKELTLISSSALTALLEKGVVEQTSEEVYRKEYQTKKTIIKDLTDDQQKILEEIQNSSDEIFLLHGVTGSGKTEVYMQLIEKVIQEGKQAIVLVPEISLTEQMTSRFTERFDRIAVLHSRLSDGEKYDEYRRIKKGEVDIVIGARSAIFAPLSKIGCIILDEEHSQSYKQENAPRYHAKEIAILRSKYHHAKVILGSATPSLESYARAKKNVYHLLSLTRRINQKPLPNVEIIDMNEEAKKGNVLFSKRLVEKIKNHTSFKNQVMLLLNRRGYASFLTCKNCSHVMKCPHCDITLTYHKGSNNLRCHYCGYATSVPKRCPSCQEDALTNLGVGTEKVEEKLHSLFPELRILRMDLDTTTTKGSHEKMIQAFQNQEYDILLGTQMIAKGLDFPQVTLVGVINADTSLNIPDFRSSEETFQLLSQVAGRSGRSEKEGEVCIQTFNPDHYAIQYAKRHDYNGFYNHEMQIRHQLGYPPYYYLTLIRISGKQEEKCQAEAQKISIFLKKQLLSTDLLGPSPAAVWKVNNVYRYQIILKYKKEEQLQKVLRYLQNHYKGNREVKIDFDFYPLHF